LNPHASTDRLAELLCRKLQVLEEVLSISNAQREIVSRDEVDSLMELLAAKQTLLDQMHSLQTALAPYRDEDPQQRVWHSPRRREQTQQVAARCEAILAEIMQIEKECEQQLVARRNEVAADLKAADLAERARDAYAPSLSPATRFEIVSDV
jgi:hypothetical protein